MKVLKRPHRSGSVRMVRNKPDSNTNAKDISVEPSVPLSISEEETQTKLHPLSNVLGTYGGEAWEEFRATLLRLRQADAEDDSIE
jgi:hypothetical protein